jgi:type II secretory pathway pseudopilin PulG
VVKIIGVIAAIAQPLMIRGTEGAAGNALTDDLATLRKANDLYQTEHIGAYPTDPTNQLVQYTDESGNTSPTQDAAYRLGPYLRTIPPVPVGARKGNNAINPSGNPGTNVGGWLYDAGTGAIKADSGSEKDRSGRLYSDY